MIYVFFTVLVGSSTVAGFAACEGEPAGPGVSVCLGARSATAACVRALRCSACVRASVAADATAVAAQWFSLFLSFGLLASCYWSFQTWRTLQVRIMLRLTHALYRPDALAIAAV